MSRFDLGKVDGEDVLNGTIKVGSFEIIQPKKYMHGDKIQITLEVEVDPKKGFSHVVKDSTLTRVHHARAIRAAVVEEGDLMDAVLDFWLNRPDEVGTEPMEFPAHNDEGEDAEIVDLSTHLDDMPPLETTEDVAEAEEAEVEADDAEEAPAAEDDAEFVINETDHPF